MRQQKNRTGFTLVELIVVLVILGILVAMLVPALTGYIRIATEKSAIAECRQVVLAAQTISTEIYGRGKTDREALQAELLRSEAQILSLAETDGKLEDLRLDPLVGAKIGSLLYTVKGGLRVLYDITKTPVYSIVDLNGENVGAYQEESQGILDKITPPSGGHNDKSTKEVQQEFKKQCGGEFPALSEYERNIIKAKDADKLVWRPIVTAEGVIMVADNGGDKSNSNASMIYYKGQYYYHMNGHNTHDTGYVSDNAAAASQKELLEELKNATAAGTKGWVLYSPK